MPFTHHVIQNVITKAIITSDQTKVDL